MSLEGLRAWIGEVERKLGKRTRVFLALAVIAIGLSGAAIYLAIDARESSVSESDVQELQKELEAQIDAAAATPGTVDPAPIEPGGETAPGAESEPAPPEPKPGASGSGGASPDGAANGADGGTGTGAAATGGASKAKIQELLEQAKEQNAEAEAEQAEK